MKYLNTLLLAVIAVAVSVGAYHVRAMDNRSAFNQLTSRMDSLKSVDGATRRDIVKEEAQFLKGLDPTYAKTVLWYSSVGASGLSGGNSGHSSKDKR